MISKMIFRRGFGQTMSLPELELAESRAKAWQLNGTLFLPFGSMENGRSHIISGRDSSFFGNSLWKCLALQMA